VAEMVQRETAQINLRIDPDLKEAAERAALADRRSLSALIKKLLTDYCREHGFGIGEQVPSRKRRR
jgi:predicted HicB family RNase H-like nuclease